MIKYNRLDKTSGKQREQLLFCRSGFCDAHSNTFTLLSLSHFATTLEVCLGSLSIWKTHLRPSFNFLTDVLNVASIYPHIWSLHVHPIFLFPHNMMLLPPCFTVGMVFFGLPASPLVLQTKRWSVWQNSSIFVSSDQRTFFQKVRSLSPCAVVNRSLAFL